MQQPGPPWLALSGQQAVAVQQQYYQQLAMQQFYQQQSQTNQQFSQLKTTSSSAPPAPPAPSCTVASPAKPPIALPWMPIQSAISAGTAGSPLRPIQQAHQWQIQPPLQRPLQQPQQRPMLHPQQKPMPYRHQRPIQQPRPALNGPQRSAPAARPGPQLLSEGEAGLRPDEERVMLNYSQVPVRAGDLFAHQKRLQLVAPEPADARGVEQLRPTARFLFDTGLALVRAAYAKDEDAETGHPAELPDVDHLLASFKFRCHSCSFRGDTELSVLLHYQRGHLSEDGVYSCALDRYGTRDAQAFRQHMSRMHQLVGLPEDKPPAYACTFCCFGAATPAVFYRHLPLCIAAAAGDGSSQLLAPNPSLDLNCCLLLDSLHRFGVSELHGRLEPGVFRGRQIVMPKGSYRPLPAAPPVAAPSADAASPEPATAGLPKLQQTKPAKPQQQKASVGRPDGLFSSRPTPLGSFTPRVAAPLRVSDPSSAASSNQPQQRRPIFHCELCNGLCASASALAAHLAASHPDALGGGAAGQAQQLQGRIAAAIAASCGAACPDCGRGFVTRRGLEAHRASGGCPIGRLCAFCQRPFDLARHHLLGHLAERHPRELRSLIARGVCPVCVASAGAAGQLLRHLASAHGIVVSLGSGAVSFAPRPGAGRAPNDCPACSRCFATELQLRDHMLAEGHAYRCHRCRADGSGQPPLLLPTREAWVAHLLGAHATDRERCPACSETHQVGLPLTCHLLRSHTRPCSVRLKRFSRAELAAASAADSKEPPAKRMRLAA